MRLETKRLILREWKARDVADLVEGLNDIKVARWLAFVPHPYTNQDARKWIARCRGIAAKGRNRSCYDFAIELKSERKVIGGVSLERINRFHGTAGGGIWINANYHGQGVGSEAWAAKIQFAFERLKLRRLENGFFRGNRASLRMQQALGYKLEGVRRKAMRCMADGKFKDECITALLKEQWKPRRVLR
jgi:[ribosomal protein S5]-alanine N-acetyltransferase